ncbi:hypothetical protein ACIQRW_24390 [Streptomyces sp. NPDC091287]
MTWAIAAGAAVRGVRGEAPDRELAREGAVSGDADNVYESKWT